MKQPESNPLRKELARSLQAGAHPDCDVLSAFAEGSLLARERESVLAHLALCTQCREVLHIATDASPELVAEARLKTQPKPLARPVYPRRRSWMPWVAAAATVLVVSSVLLLHEQTRSAGRAPSVESARMANTEPTHVPAAPPPPSEAKIAPRKTPSSVARSETSLRRAENSTDAAARAATHPPAPSQEQRTQAIPPQGEATNSSRNAMVGSMVSSAQRAESPESRAEVPAVAMKKYHVNSEQIPGAKAAPAASEAVEVQREAAMQSGDAFSAAANGPTMSKAIHANAARPHWRINDLGQLERSFVDGTWQAVLMPDASKLHVVSLSGNEVWAGGENLRLEHSSDNGATWESVKLTAKNGYEHAITHIRFRTPQEGTINSDDGTSWITTDGGRTWK